MVLQVLLLSTEASSSCDCADGGTACADCLIAWLLQQNMYMFFAKMRFSQSLSESVCSSFFPYLRYAPAE
jgi:hypothetical protein